MPEPTKQDQKTDGLAPLVKRKRTLIARYESQVGSTITPVARSLITRAVSIEITFELMEAEQIAGTLINAEKHMRLAGALVRLLDRLGLAASSGTSAKTWIYDSRANTQRMAQERATAEGWSDDQRDRYAERLYEQEMAAV